LSQQCPCVKAGGQNDIHPAVAVYISHGNLPASSWACVISDRRLERAIAVSKQDSYNTIFAIPGGFACTKHNDVWLAVPIYVGDAFEARPAPPEPKTCPGWNVPSPLL